VSDRDASLGLTDLFHVGIAVHDLDEAKRRYASELGIDPWATFDGEFEGIYRGEKIVLAARVGYAQSGAGYVELVQPTKGEWTASVFLAERGEGVYHLGYWVDDLAWTLRRAAELGYPTDIVSAQGGFAYLDATRSAGVHIELVSEAVRPAIERLFSNPTA
jgi:catechol 2,3-dioxygenase-like lactoylglutathione lyase family enzyme